MSYYFINKIFGCRQTITLWGSLQKTISRMYTKSYFYYVFDKYFLKVISFNKTGKKNVGGL